MCLIAFSEFSTLLEKFNYKSFSMGSVQDSVSVETKIGEIIDIVHLFNNYFNNIMRYNFKFMRVPIKMDLSIGVSLGSYLSLSILSKNEFILEGLNYDYVLLLNKLKGIYKIKTTVLSSSPVTVSSLSLLNKINNLENIKVKMELIKL